MRENVPSTEEDRCLHLEMVLEDLEKSEDILDQPPDDFDYISFIESIKDNSVMKDSIQSQSKNQVIDEALKALPKTTLFVKILRRRIFFWLKRQVKENLCDTSFSMAFLKEVAKKVCFMSRDEEVRSLLMLVLKGRSRGELGETEICFCSDLACKIYQEIFEAIAN